MENGMRLLVAIMLTLVSLSVLSLHIALCLHYPSGLFAVTLLLNPSLWLFIGLVFMFCSLVIKMRDQKRKLLPADLTTCSSLLGLSSSPPRKNLHLKYRPKHPKCDCRRSVHATAYFDPATSTCESFQVVTHVEDSDCTNSSSSTLVHSHNPSSHAADEHSIQNFSCQVRTRNYHSGYQNSLVYVKNINPQYSKKRAKMAFCSYGENSPKFYAVQNTSDEKAVNNFYPLRSKLLKSQSLTKDLDKCPSDIHALVKKDFESDSETVNDCTQIRRMKHTPFAFSNRPNQINLNPPKRLDDRCTCSLKLYRHYDRPRRYLSLHKPPENRNLTPVHLFESKDKGQLGLKKLELPPKVETKGLNEKDISNIKNEAKSTEANECLNVSNETDSKNSESVQGSDAESLKSVNSETFLLS